MTYKRKRQLLFPIERGKKALNSTSLQYSVIAVCTSLLGHLQVRQAELNLPVQTARSHQGRVECVRSVGGHQNLDVPTRVEPVQLVDELQHGPLDLVVSTGAIIKSSTWQVQKYNIEDCLVDLK